MPPPPELMEELVEEILLRIPADDPATLVRAALVCRSWRRLVLEPRFRRRFREFNRAPPLLGFLCNNNGNRRSNRGPYVSRFVPTSSFLVPPDRAAGRDRDWRALEARDGRVLLQFRSMRTFGASGPTDLVVWDPVTDDRRELPCPRWVWNSWNVAVLCAHTGAACDHLDCRGGPFVVVSLGTDGGAMDLFVYSSEDGSWSEPARVTSSPAAGHVFMKHTALAGNTLYFQFQIYHGRRILGYDLDTRETSVVELPPLQEHEDDIALMTLEDGGLGVAILDSAAMLSLWSMEASRSNGDMGWTEFRVIDLEKLLSVEAPSICYGVVGFAHGVGVFTFWTSKGLFSFHLASGQVRKVLEAEACKEDHDICSIVPYISFCAPALGAGSTGEEPAAPSA